MKKKIFVFICIILFSFSFIFNFYQQKMIKDKNIELSKNKETIQKLENKIKKQQDKIESLEFEFKPTEKHPIIMRAEECIKEQNYTNSAMAQCVYDSEVEWRKEIFKNLKRLKTVTTKETYDQIEESQKYWELYRKTQAQVYFKTLLTQRGTMYIPITANLVVGLTQDRANELSFILEQIYGN